MMKHKWHDEIVAWAGNKTCIEANKAGIWFGTDYPQWNDTQYEFRIKPQDICKCQKQACPALKEKKYLHIILQPNGSITLRTHPVFCGEEEYFGKIEVQDD